MTRDGAYTERPITDREREELNDAANKEPRRINPPDEEAEIAYLQDPWLWWEW